AFGEEGPFAGIITRTSMLCVHTVPPSSGHRMIVRQHRALASIELRVPAARGHCPYAPAGAGELTAASFQLQKRPTWLSAQVGRFRLETARDSRNRHRLHPY